MSDRSPFSASTVGHYKVGNRAYENFDDMFARQYAVHSAINRCREHFYSLPKLWEKLYRLKFTLNYEDNVFDGLSGTSYLILANVMVMQPIEPDPAHEDHAFLETTKETMTRVWLRDGLPIAQELGFAYVSTTDKISFNETTHQWRLTRTVLCAKNIL